jgi:hypothetical protein
MMAFAELQISLRRLKNDSAPQSNDFGIYNHSYALIARQS